VPHTQCWAPTNGVPSRRPSAIRSSLFPKRNPRFAHGRACNQVPELGDEEARRRARSTESACRNSLEDISRLIRRHRLFRNRLPIGGPHPRDLPKLPAPHLPNYLESNGCTGQYTVFLIDIIEIQFYCIRSCISTMECANFVNNPNVTIQL
jgi:hypothetical protein